MKRFTVLSHVISTDNWFSNSSIFGKWGLILMQLSFSFLESSAIFTDLSLFTVVTTGDTKQSSSTSFIFSNCSDLLLFLVPVRHLLEGVVVLVLLFVKSDSVLVLIGCLSRCLLSFHCSRISPEIC